MPKRRILRARRRMNRVMNELSCALLIAGGKDIDLHLTREEEGLRLRLEGDFLPEHQQTMERMAKLLQPAVRDPALAETYGELMGEEHYSGESEIALVGHILDESRVVVEPGKVKMDVYLAF